MIAAIDLTTIWTTVQEMGILEFLGLVFGLLCVLLLIRENILTWICGIIYVLISFVIFYQARLYGDFILHVIFLVMNIYGWYSWIRGRAADDQKMPISRMDLREHIYSLGGSLLGILLFGYFLKNINDFFSEVPPADLPFWDSTTSILSVTGMWLTARKKIENWYYWLAVDVLATGIYYYKELYFYSALYFIYIGLAVAGYLAWQKSWKKQEVI